MHVLSHPGPSLSWKGNAQFGTSMTGILVFSLVATLFALSACTHSTYSHETMGVGTRQLLVSRCEATGRRLAAAGPDAGSRLTASCATGPQLASALADQSIQDIVLTSDITLMESDWSNWSLPLKLVRNVTLRGVNDNWDMWIVLDINFIKSKVQLQRTVMWTFRYLVLYRYREDPQFMAPGLDLIAAGPVPSGKDGLSWPAVFLDHAAYIQRTCNTVAEQIQSAAHGLPRPSGFPGNQTSIFNMTQAGCVQVPENAAVTTTMARPTQRCWPLAGLRQDFVTFAFDLDRVSGRQVMAGYLVIIRQGDYFCDKIMSEECSRLYTPAGCFWRMFPRNASNTTSTISSSSSGGGGTAIPAAPATTIVVPRGPSSSSSSSNHHIPVGPLVGGILGGLAAVSIVVVIVAFKCHHHCRYSSHPEQLEQLERQQPMDSSSGRLPASNPKFWNYKAYNVYGVHSSDSGNGRHTNNDCGDSSNIILGGLHDVAEEGSTLNTSEVVHQTRTCKLLYDDGSRRTSAAVPRQSGRRKPSNNLPQFTSSAGSLLPMAATTGRFDAFNGNDDPLSLVPVTSLTPLHPDIKLDINLEDSNQVKISRATLGKGAFGRVVKGTYCGMDVAVKLLDYGLLPAELYQQQHQRAQRADDGDPASPPLPPVTVMEALPRVAVYHSTSAVMLTEDRGGPLVHGTAVLADGNSNSRECEAIRCASSSSGAHGSNGQPPTTIELPRPRCVPEDAEVPPAPQPALLMSESTVEDYITARHDDPPTAGLTAAAAQIAATNSESPAAAADCNHKNYKVLQAENKGSSSCGRGSGGGGAGPTDSRPTVSGSSSSSYGADTTTAVFSNDDIDDVDVDGKHTSHGITPRIQSVVATAPTTSNAAAAAAAEGASSTQQQQGQQPALRAKLSNLPEATLKQEVEILARCQHPNIIRLFAACLKAPRLCLVMELMETSLDRLLYSSGCNQLLPLDMVLHIASQIARGLAYLHPTIVHRDLKPANVLMSSTDSGHPVIKLADFGLSRLRDTVLITRNPEVGTVPYIAPEVFDGGNFTITDRVDVYALGILMWEMLAGQRPWEGWNVVMIALAVGMNDQRPPLERLSEERCPPKLRALILGCWDRVPARRPAAADVVKALALIQQMRKMIHT